MNYESHIIAQIDRESDAAEDRAEKLRKLIPQARNHWKMLLREHNFSPSLVSSERLRLARQNVVRLVKQLQEIN